MTGTSGPECLMSQRSEGKSFGEPGIESGCHTRETMAWDMGALNESSHTGCNMINKVLLVGRGLGLVTVMSAGITIIWLVGYLWCCSCSCWEHTGRDGKILEKERMNYRVDQNADGEFQTCNDFHFIMVRDIFEEEGLLNLRASSTSFSRAKGGITTEELSEEEEGGRIPLSGTGDTSTDGCMG